MNRTIQIELPEDVYTSLVEAAKRSGQQPEAVAAQLLTSAVHNGSPHDPLEQFIGAFKSPAEYGDWADNHDKYLGETLYREMIPKDGDRDA